ncbi:atypical membrane-integrating protein (Mistic protein) [Terrilactibacillus sp. BCM23-1]|uniref:Atypical membrane-integrating protein (Mistic protein) n=1 Tax=Terrilactibacillus tamarindi TaxID=2599694 RepID=A0A6N8CLJ7_9BACI|nr:atypical membrane-integrating protein (Mistic protein) [Terrilactibacillus tamarindi]MTT30824.1 atypical membrane-integrating protein (Mistic protein) [Terrilactibacillus tamarindi]
MKANDQERDKFDKALDTIINLFNELEDDEPIVEFDPDVIQKIEIAKKIYGANVINERINNVVKEILTLLPLDAEIDEEDEDDS